MKLKRNYHIPAYIQWNEETTNEERAQLEQTLLLAIRRAIDSSATEISEPEVSTSQTQEDLSEVFSSSRYHADRETYSVPSYNESGALAEMPVAKFTSEGQITLIEEWLEGQYFDTSTLDWNIELPRLLSRWPGPYETAMDISDYYRYQMFLQMLQNEVQSNEHVPGAIPVDDIDLMGSYILEYLLHEVPLETFPEETLKIHSKMFLAEWIETIRQIKYIPEDFDRMAFRPDKNKIEEERQNILSEFMKSEAPRLIIIFILDEWVRSGRPPEEWLANLDIDKYRKVLIQQLAKKFIEYAKKIPAYYRAFQDVTIQQTKFETIIVIYNLVKSIEKNNQDLYDKLSETPMEDLTDFEWEVATNPNQYAEISNKIAEATIRFLSEIRPGYLINIDLLKWAVNVLESINLPEEYAISVLLIKFLATLDNFKQLHIKEQEKAKEIIIKEVDVNFQEVADTVRNHVNHAERFIREKWLPRLKKVAKDKLDENYNELLDIYNNWEYANNELIYRLCQAEEELEQITLSIEDGTYESIELEGEIITINDIQQLRITSQFLRDEINIRLDPERMEEKKKELWKAIEIFKKVKKDIDNDEYDPLDYAKPVYEEARSQLGISEFPEWTTVGVILTHKVVAKENPFLAASIVHWRWKEGTERTFWEITKVAGFVTLSLASILVPGIGGVILAALDIGINIVMGIHHVVDTYELLDMARLDIHQDIREIGVEEAERALKHAWIGFGLNILLSVGLVALRKRLVYKEKGGRILTASKTTKLTKMDKIAKRRLFEKTTITPDSTLPPGEGWIDSFGNITYSTLGTQTEQNLVRYHETVHSFLSPKLRILRNFRARLRSRLYGKPLFELGPGEAKKGSSLLRYLEEALAETYAQLRLRGLRGLPEGIKFPIANGYVEVSSVMLEGAVGTIVVGGTTYGIYIYASEE